MKPEEVQRRIDYFESKVKDGEANIESRDEAMMESEDMKLWSTLQMKKMYAIEHEAYLQYCKRRLKHYRSML